MMPSSPRQVWGAPAARAIVAAVLGAGLFLLCACATQAHSTATPTHAPRAANTAVPTGTAPGLPTATPAPSPLPSLTPADRQPTDPLATTGHSPSDADLAIQVSGPAGVVPGETAVYTLTVRNGGPDAATGLVLTDTLPSGTVPVWAQPAQLLCRRQERSMHCSVGDVWEDGAVTVTLDLSVGRPGAPITDTQLAGVTLDASVPTCTIDEDAAQPTVTCRLAHLPAGAEAHARIGVAVDSAATGALLHTATAAGDQADANHSNNQAAFTTTVDTAAPVAEAPRPTTADLAVRAEGPLSVVAGQPFTHALTVTNRGPLDATDVALYDILPLATDLVAYEPHLPECERRGDAFTCYLREPGSGRTLTFTLAITGHGGQSMIVELDPLMPGWPVCTVMPERTYLYVLVCELGTLRPGQSTRIELLLNAIGVQEREIVNTATASTSETEVNPLDNTSTTTITVQTSADLSIWSSFSGQVSAGRTLSYTLFVANDGPSDAADVVLTDTLPVGIRLVSAATSLGLECGTEQDGASIDTVSCILRRLDAGTTATVTVAVAVDRSLIASLEETLVHSAGVTSQQPDPDPGNNQLTEPFPAAIGLED